MYEPRQLPVEMSDNAFAFVALHANIGEAAKTLRRSHDDHTQSSREAHKCGHVKGTDREDAGGGRRVREV